ncbi:hypothetical protein AV530_019040 [Patagioenas fasciata monilis]|uniref:Uncharacterized protein n=1 Tax=Patagioenas fasciata monilis TaxID=372326 RepID=A0A1V4KWU7_PATFA|nr:hypothetical protein AV530_019040 [Patagioenas fasciata monilis]
MNDQRVPLRDRPQRLPQESAGQPGAFRRRSLGRPEPDGHRPDGPAARPVAAESSGAGRGGAGPAHERRTRPAVHAAVRSGCPFCPCRAAAGAPELLREATTRGEKTLSARGRIHFQFVPQGTTRMFLKDVKPACVEFASVPPKVFNKY